ncbi:alpha/beta hydrolase [Phaeobacter piscinae]|uniref:alpha/beta hydrolase n=1 Tax=Phaeobacter piscinae TaxID=1580596 RepID=UPI000BBE82A6|nr:alpha/beta hydrolase [Phaeobacter piscinae]ATG41796.1 Lysophospholipase [Phaeobacter piscinae]AUR38220.1 Lysophospholipase [Phaeobacter piscinae]
MLPAPLEHEIAEAPKDGVAYWIQADDGTRLRVGLWKGKDAQKGTILVFPGRSEYIEKYGRTVSDLQKLGYTALVIDWRGQGLADRAADDPMAGHVVRFSDFHKDVAAMTKAAQDLDLPKPWYLIGHSLGACIGLRAIAEGLPVSACAFTGPMWNINLPAVKRAAAWPLSWAAQAIGKGHVYAPGTDGKSYVLSTAFADNRLTNDPEMYQYFINQATLLKEHQIGGPSLGWLFQTLNETRAVSKLPSPKIPCLTFCGDQDVVVDLPAIHDRMGKWPSGRLDLIENAKHDVFSEVPQIRERVTTEIAKLFTTGSNQPAVAAR